MPLCCSDRLKGQRVCWHSIACIALATARAAPCHQSQGFSVPSRSTCCCPPCSGWTGGRGPHSWAGLGTRFPCACRQRRAYLCFDLLYQLSWCLQHQQCQGISSAGFNMTTTEVCLWWTAPCTTSNWIAKQHMPKAKQRMASMQT